MSFKPQQLDERTLKSFVDRLLAQLKQYQAQPKPTRAKCQEHVARMLGFSNWHEAIHAIRPIKSPPGPSPKDICLPSNSEPLGIFPVSPMTAPSIAEQCVRWAFSHGASDVYLGLGEKVLALREGKGIPLTQSHVSYQECQAFLHAFPPTQGKHPEQVLKENPNIFHVVKVPLDPVRPDLGSVVIHRCVTPRDGQSGVSSSFRLVPHLIPALSGWDMPPPLYQSLQDPPGMVVIAGETMSGRTTLLSSIAQACAQTPNSKVSFVCDTMEYPVDQLSCSQGSKVFVYDGMAKIEANLQAVSKQDRGVVVIDRAITIEAVEKSLLLERAGHRVYMGQHAGNVPDAITRPLRGWEDWREKLPGWLNSISLVLCQRLVCSTDGRLIPVIEWMEMTPQNRKIILGLSTSSRDPVHLRKMLDVQFNELGQSFLSWGKELSASGKIDKETFKNLVRESESRARAEY